MFVHVLDAVAISMKHQPRSKTCTKSLSSGKTFPLPLYVLKTPEVISTGFMTIVPHHSHSPQNRDAETRNPFSVVLILSCTAATKPDSPVRSLCSMHVENYAYTVQLNEKLVIPKPGSVDSQFWLPHGSLDSQCETQWSTFRSTNASNEMSVKVVIPGLLL